MLLLFLSGISFLIILVKEETTLRFTREGCRGVTNCAHVIGLPVCFHHLVVSTGSRKRLEKKGETRENEGMKAPSMSEP